MARPTNESKDRLKRELSEKQLAYVIWAADPPDLRQPATKDELAQVLDVSRQTLWRWERDPRVLDAVRFVVLQNAGDPKRIGQLLDIIFEDAVASRDLKKAELWLRSTGVLGQFTRSSGLLDYVESADGGFADFSLEELERMRKEAAASEAERQAMLAAKAVLA